MDLQDFAGQTALVTGSTSGLGAAIATTLARYGAEVVVHGRDAGRGATVVQAITEAGGRARFVAADLSGPAGPGALADAAGPVDVLVNNAAIRQPLALVKETAESFDRHLAVNARAPMLLVAALAPALIARGAGAIVNVSTGEVATPARDASAYSASKAALAHLTLAWAAELGPAGVRVNAVQPGPIRTQALAALPAPVIEALARLSAVGRIAEPSEIAEMVAFLASPRAAYLNGTIVEVHGGRPAIG